MMVTDCAKTVKKIASRVPGKCGPTAMTYLCELVQGLTVPGWIVDLGTYHGRSAMVMQMASMGDGMKRRIVSIDNYQEGPAAAVDEGPYPDVFEVQARFR